MGERCGLVLLTPTMCLIVAATIIPHRTLVELWVVGRATASFTRRPRRANVRLRLRRTQDWNGRCAYVCKLV
ncbi:hypothetical protein CHLRE_04g228625v5 [Chlamydomonas reinhardtii]|uniref:Uncharacterized protein n=1 Tax=Chlamydomonas reinhardtii TaxID=3055 RepID=A0A2K3DUW0_CHLRE|nr:uncharacterized protein CHLRE_04g228625v5 [Chlamydomonas reinhardtii]PNW84294.1 hypothetical protein CHLRE_04g228625v5 [Chlamydomonas reinhardtii]